MFIRSSYVYYVTRRGAALSKAPPTFHAFLSAGQVPSRDSQIAGVRLTPTSRCRKMPNVRCQSAGRGHCQLEAAGAAMVVTSYRMRKRSVMSVRRWTAQRWCRRRRKCLPTWPHGSRNHCACSGDVNRCKPRSRRRGGGCAFSAWLFRPLCGRCSTPGSTVRNAAP